MTQFADLADKVYAKADGIVQRDIAGETLLVPVRGKLADLQRVFALEELPVFIWEHLDGQRTAAQIHQAVVDSYDVDGVQAEKDLAEFLDELLESGLIELK